MKSCLLFQADIDNVLLNSLFIKELPNPDKKHHDAI